MSSRTLPRASDGQSGAGIYVDDGGSVAIRSSAVLDNHAAALLATDAGSVATVADTLLARTKPQEQDLLFGYGAYAGAGARVTRRMPSR